MAHTATHTGFERATGRSFLVRLGAMFVAYAEARSRYPEIQALQALSDDQLAQRGLTRDGIVRHVYSDMFYL